MKNVDDHSGLSALSHQELLDDAALDAEIAALVERIRPRLVPPKFLTSVVLLSMFFHAGATFALMMNRPIEPAAPQVFREERIFNLQLDYLAGVENGEESVVAEEAVAEVVEPAVVPEQKVRRERRREDSPVVEQAETFVPSVEALAEVPGASTVVNIPAAVEGPPTPATSPTMVASASSHVAISTTPSNAGVSGGTEGIDIDGLRRGHISRLNRAIRSQNPCSPELRRSAARGDVIVALQQNEDGSVAAVRVARTSGNPEIDAAALDFVRAQRRLPRPDSALIGDTWTLPMRFECGR